MIEVENLSKRYGKTRAVDHVTFDVRPGRVAGFLGPNGSGKSTTMRMILHLDHPTTGSVRLNGQPYTSHPEPMRVIGSLLDANAVEGARTAENHLRWLAHSNDINPARVRDTARQRSVQLRDCTDGHTTVAHPLKCIGLIGGMSWESSIEYERIINEEVRARLGGVHSADLIIRSFDFAEVEALQQRNDWESAGRLLADAARTLTQAGAELLVLCTNTMHQVFDAIAEATHVPVLHIADATAAAIERQQVGTVGLLGTRYTMERPFYRERMERQGIRVRVPNDDERTVIHDVIYNELVRGVVSDESRNSYLTVIERMIDDGCEGIIAGCTEIELLVRPDHVRVPFFATTRLHALAAVDAALTA